MARKAFALAALFGCLSLAIGLTDLLLERAAEKGL